MIRVNQLPLISGGSYVREAGEGGLSPDASFCLQEDEPITGEGIYAIHMHHATSHGYAGEHARGDT